MRTRKMSAAVILVLAIAGVLASTDSWAAANKVPLVDACLYIDIAFCKDGGSGGQISDLPSFISGFVIYNEPAQRFSMITLMVRGSLPNTAHLVFGCPGTMIRGVGGAGFTGCTLLGSFLTNINGNGAFQANLSGVVTDAVIAINVTGFDTILANDPVNDPIQ